MTISWKRSSEVFRKIYLYINYFGLIKGLWILANLRVIGKKRKIYSVNLSPLQRTIHLRRKTSDVYVFQDLILDSDKRYITPAIKKDIENIEGDVIDGGANIGISTLIFALTWPNKKICAIECSSENVEILKRNVEGLANVVVLEAALWKEDGYVVIDNKQDDNWSFKVTEVDSHAVSKNTIQAFSLKTVIERIFGGGGRIAFLKLDIEGAERELFLGHNEWREFVSRLLVELHERKSPGCKSAFKKFVESAKAKTEKVGEYVYVTTQAY